MWEPLLLQCHHRRVWLGLDEWHLFGAVARVSVAGFAITTGAVVAELPKKEAYSHGGAPSGMGDMGF